MTKADPRTLPPPSEQLPFITLTRVVIAQFWRHRRAGDQPRTGVLLGTWSPEGYRIHITETVPWADPIQRETTQPHPFVVNSAYLWGYQEGLHRSTQSEPPILQIGQWLVMPETTCAAGESMADATQQTGEDEVVLLERAREEGWLNGPQLITAVREERGLTRIRAYLLDSGGRVRQITFPEEELNPAALTVPFRLNDAEGTGPLHRQFE